MPVNHFGRNAAFFSAMTLSTHVDVFEAGADFRSGKSRAAVAGLSVVQMRFYACLYSSERGVIPAKAPMATDRSPHLYTGSNPVRFNGLSGERSERTVPSC